MQVSGCDPTNRRSIIVEFTLKLHFPSQAFCPLKSSPRPHNDPFSELKKILSSRGILPLSLQNSSLHFMKTFYFPIATTSPLSNVR